MAAESIADVVYAAYFGKLSTDLLASNRLYTYGPQLARQGGAFFLHQLLRRVLQKAFVCDDDGAGGDDEDDFHAHCTRKMKAAVAFVSSDEAPRTFAFALVGAAATDYLSYRLQHLGFGGGAMQELTDDGHKGLLFQTQARYWELLNPWKDSIGAADARVVTWHLKHYQDFDFVDEFRGICLGMAAAVWRRLQLRSGRG